MCIIEFIGLLLAAFGASFSAIPCRRFDSLVRWLIPQYKRANSGLERLKKGREITGSELNWLLKNKARSLCLKKGNGFYIDTSTGATALENQLILDERGETVCSVDIAGRELDGRIRNARVYIGLGIAAIGFVLQAAALGISCFE